MTIALETQSNARQDPAYRQAMAYLQEGEWQRAINAFETLQRQYPGHVQIARALDEARFKAGIDDQSQVKAKRWAGGSRLRLMPIVLLLILAVGGYQAVRIYESRIKPAMAEARLNAQLDNLLTQALAFIDSGALDDAQKLIQEYLAARPDDEEAQAALVRLEERRALVTRYEEGVQAEVAEAFPAALAAYTDVLMIAPDYRDVKTRISRIQQRTTLNDLLTQANTLYDMGAKAEAAGYYRQIQDLDNNFERVYIAERLFAIYYGLGIAELDQPSIQLAQVRTALDRFQEALQQQPSNRDALQQQRLARTYLAARERYDDRDWHDAVRRLRDIYELDANYLGNTVVQLLYDAYVGSGDLYRADNDLYLAYDQYSKAAALPGVDTVVARGRIFEIQPFLTPTATPTITPTPSNTPTITPIPPTAAPTPTPTPRAFSNFRGRIVFQSDNEEQPGYWVMNADGTNREYIGVGKFYDDEYAKTIEQHQYSPDGRYRAFVGRKSWDKASQVYVARPPHPEYGKVPDRAISQLTGLSYDPVWSPDGGRIAFVSQENESDDIWIANADGSDRRALMRNPWEWDKSPTWSPDSQRLAFWSNRTGTKQIFVMDANGQNVRNISNVPWDEYNPVWIR